MKPFLFTLLLVTGVACFGSAMAQESTVSSTDIKRAAAFYDQGRERYREGEYTEAAEQFEAANDSAPNGAALRLAMLSRKEAGQLARALTHATLALELYPDEHELRLEARSLIDEEGGEFGQINVTCDSPCGLLLGARLVHGPPSQQRLIYVQPGTVTITASWSEGRSQTESTDVYSEGLRELDFYAPVEDQEQASALVAVTATEKEEEPSVEEEVKERDGWHPSIFWTSFGLTLGGLGTSIALGVNAKNSPGTEAVIDGCVAGDISCPEMQQGRKNQGYANLALGITAALGAFTITSAFFTDWGKPGSDESDEDDKPQGYDGWNGDTWSYRDGDLFIQPTVTLGNSASLGATGTF